MGCKSGPSVIYEHFGLLLSHRHLHAAGACNLSLFSIAATVSHPNKLEGAYGTKGWGIDLQKKLLTMHNLD